MTEYSTGRTSNPSKSSTAASHSRAARLLPTIANIAVIVASGAVLWVALQRSQQPAQAPESIYELGEHIGGIEGLDFRASPQTLLMVLREDCRFCRDSVPFYRELTSAVRESSDHATRVVVASTDRPESMESYLKASDVHVDQVVGVRPGALKVPGTPFLLLVDTNGVVQRFWRGRLAGPQEQEVFAVLGLPALD